jgi:serine/threonine protein kinase
MEQTSFNAANLRQLNDHISKLLIHAVVPMNQLGVIHNDLKSENVMIDRTKNSRIIDWGLAGITTPAQVIPAHHFMNNPVTFNRPFSTMVISTDTLELAFPAPSKPHGITYAAFRSQTRTLVKNQHRHI